MCCKNKASEMDNSWGPQMENGYVRTQTCDRCLAGIQESIKNVKEGQEEIKELISANKNEGQAEIKELIESDKKDTARKQMLWIAIVSLIIGFLSNYDKIAKIFR